MNRTEVRSVRGQSVLPGPRGPCVARVQSPAARCSWRRNLGGLLLLLAGVCVGRSAERILTLDKGLDFETPLLHPGKADFLFKHLPEQNQYNLMGWSPSFKGGAGLLDPDTGDSTFYGGGYVRPLLAWPKAGELILGAQGLDAANENAVEFQGEYRFPFGLGLGGGFVDTTLANRDIEFGKVTFRNRWGRWNYIFEVQGQHYGDEAFPGGYGAVYNAAVMGVLGTDGEQWRANFGFVSPWTNAFVRPTLEVLYVDNSIGEFDGPKVWFANATLGYSGGFLSHPARLGRAMGPQGLEFGNPLGFLSPTWNRRLEVWEMGRLADFRAEHLTAPDGATTERYEGLVFPFQFAGTKTVLDHVFAGGSYFKSRSKDTPGVIGGVTGKVWFFDLSVGVEYQFETDETTVVVGVIDTF